MRKIALSIIVLLLTATVAYAECFICDNAASDNFGTKATYKLVRGLGNTLFGWMEIFLRPGREMDAGVPMATAVVAGLGEGIVRTGNGILEAVTFWNPGETGHAAAADCPVCGINK